MKLKIVFSALLIYCLTLSGYTQFRLELVAADIPWTNSQYIGNSFLCLSKNGTETCYGFYPRATVKGFIGGLDVDEPSLRKSPTRYSALTVSLNKTISDQMRTGVLKLINDWNRLNYDLNDRSCIDFVASLAKELNWTLPVNDPSDTPKSYLEKLKVENELKPGIPGVWKGSMTLNSQVVPISILFQLNSGTLSGQFMVTPSNQGPCDNLSLKLDRSVSWSTGDGASKMNFTGSLAPGIRSMSGNFTSTYGNGSWQVTKQ